MAFGEGCSRPYLKGLNAADALRNKIRKQLEPERPAIKANNGFDATVEGMKFAQQLKALSKLGEVVTGLNLKAGRTARANRRDIRSGMAANRAKTDLSPEEIEGFDGQATCIRTAPNQSIYLTAREVCKTFID